MKRRIIAAAALLLLATSSFASTYPDGLAIQLMRMFSPGPHNVGEPVRIYTYMFVGESGSLSGFYYSEQFPAWISVYTDLITVNGLNRPFHMEVGEIGEIIEGHLSYRWILDDPMEGDGSVLVAGDQILISYLLYGWQDGVLNAAHEGWFAFLEDPMRGAAFGDDDVVMHMTFGSAVGVDESPAAALKLAPAFPNPFNPTTQLTLFNSRAQDLRLDIMDARGRRLTTLLDGHVEAGDHVMTWHGRDDSGNALPSGVYFARLVNAEGPQASQKLLLLK